MSDGELESKLWQLVAYTGSNQLSRERLVREALQLVADKQTAAPLDPFDYVEPCEPDCSPERHAYHQGQYAMAQRMTEDVNRPAGSVGIAEQDDTIAGLSLCRHCFCMTKTISDSCGKCGGVKVADATVATPAPVDDDTLRDIYDRCDVSNNRTDNPLSFDEFKAAVEALYAKQAAAPADDAKLREQIDKKIELTVQRVIDSGGNGVSITYEASGEIMQLIAEHYRKQVPVAVDDTELRRTVTEARVDELTKLRLDAEVTVKCADYIDRRVKELTAGKGESNE